MLAGLKRLPCIIIAGTYLIHPEISGGVGAWVLIDDRPLGIEAVCLLDQPVLYAGEALPGASEKQHLPQPRAQTKLWPILKFGLAQADA